MNMKEIVTITSIMEKKLNIILIKIRQTLTFKLEVQELKTFKQFQ